MKITKKLRAKLQNETGRVFGLMSAEEQAEMREAAMLPGAVVQHWYNEWRNGSSWRNRAVYRVTLPPSAFPPPPESESWHNPENFTPEEVEVDDGWRIPLKSEKANIPHQVRTTDGKWIHMMLTAVPFGDYPSTYRTKAPLPVKPVVAAPKAVRYDVKDAGGVLVFSLDGIDRKLSHAMDVPGFMHYEYPSGATTYQRRIIIPGKPALAPVAVWIMENAK